MKLTSEQVHLFRHNGFLKLKDRLPEEQSAKLRKAIWRNIREEVEPAVRDPEGRIIRLSGIADRDPVFLETATCPIVLDPLESLLGPNIEFIRNRHNHATLRLASEDRPERMHRDVRQWSRTIVTVIFYLEETTVENGCTLVVPGSHQFPGVGGRLYDESWTLDLLDQALPAPMPEGGMLVIDSMIMHGVGQNHTDGTRMSMTMGYHSVDEIADMENPHRMLVRGERPYDGNVPRT